MNFLYRLLSMPDRVEATVVQLFVRQFSGAKALAHTVSDLSPPAKDTSVNRNECHAARSLRPYG